MHYSQREKYEIIRLVEQSDLGVIRTLKLDRAVKVVLPHIWGNLQTLAGILYC